VSFDPTAGAFQFKSRPVVIDPYDALVQKAVQELGTALADVDVIKLEPTCPGNRLAWVTNEDLFKGRPGKQRVIHLCLRKIKDQFRKQHGQAYTVTDPTEQKRMKDTLKQFLKDVVIPHEAEHVQQEMEHGGQFGPAAEQKAEQKEEWKALEQMGMKKKARRVVDAYLQEGIDKESDDTTLIRNFSRNLGQAVRRGFLSIDEASRKVRDFADKYEISPMKMNFLRQNIQSAIGQPVSI